MTAACDPPNSETGDVSIQVSLAPRVSLAFHQNCVPTLRDLSIVNATGRQLQALEVTLDSTPSFFVRKTWRVDEVGAGQTYRVSDLDLALDAGLLGRLTEAEVAQITLTVTSSGAELARSTTPVELLARNQWGGVGHVPEMIAAFVQPNDPAVDQILKQAAEALRRNGKSPAIDGYTGGKQRAWELAWAIWASVGSLGLDYALPPASFERTGQKIRGPGQIVSNRLATCLDTTLLVCSALEQAGLNPLIVFTQGHAFAGFWLTNETFSTVVVDDVTALRKRFVLKELLLLETTLASSRPLPKLNDAVVRAFQKISKEEESKFELVVDVRRARMQAIKPLAAEQSVVSADSPGSVSPGEPEVEAAPDLSDNEIVRRDVPTLGKPRDRLDHWQRKLLDLSLKNNLLNFKSGRKAIRLETHDAGKLEDLLAGGRALRILPRPQLMDGLDPRSRAIHEGRTGKDVWLAHAAEALERGEVFASTPADELDARLVELFRSSRAALEEGGANSLYLAFGFLSWTRDPKDERKYRAPLILLPATLARKSVRAGFDLMLHEDEPRFNPTLLEMLRQDFGLTIPVTPGELTRDESGLDIRGIWRGVSQAIKEIPRWEVVEQVELSTFSFAKFLMWKDLVERTDDLRQNPVVRHLIDSPHDPFPCSIPFPDPRELDRTHAPEHIFSPLPADSSQLSAVVAASRGKDFVLIGPPGTGKSQTIANIIAHCLGEGKRVLFVSEKMAALEVVYRRLRDVGLSEFCLEVHSNKARKVEVIEQLGAAWEAKDALDASEWKKEAQRLLELREKLNVFVEHLHARHRNGLTAYVAMGRIAAGSQVSPIGLSWSGVDAHDSDTLQRLGDLADQLDTLAAEIGAVAGSPLDVVERSEWSPKWQQALIETATLAAEQAGELVTAASSFCKAVGLAEARLDARTQDGLAGLARVLPEASGRDWRFSLLPDARSAAEKMRRGVELLKLHRDRWQELSGRYRPQATALNLRMLAQDWNLAKALWWPASWFRKRPVRAALGAEACSQLQEDLQPDLDRLTELQGIEQAIAELSELSERTVGLWSGVSTSVDELARAAAFSDGLCSAVSKLAGSPDLLASLRAQLRTLLGENNSLLEPQGSLAEAAGRYLGALGRFADTRRALLELVKGTDGGGCDRLGDTPEMTAAICLRISAQGAKLRRWCAWRAARSEAVTSGLAPLVEAIEAGHVPLGAFRVAFETNYARWWLNGLVEGDSVLRLFVSAEHEKRISDFRARDDRFMELTRAWLRAKLCATLPARDAVTRSSEWGILRHEMQKKKRHLPLRELMQRIPEVVATLTPCMLMSPLSIAQYLPAEGKAFDVVVFDEASQIPVWDAIGAIARGKHVVMVGDPKQLPPTSFFARAESEEDFEYVEADLESILDECLGANIPALQLSWHYRSRHENLITFSNHHYYGGGLVTFPSPSTDDRAVRLHAVRDGLYEKGGARINKPEASALVADLVARLKSPDHRAAGLTIGVVTLNAEQQRLIEDLLDEQRRLDPSIEYAFADGALEPVFVKNLESVQGDERDVMYLSVTYGPDVTGAVSMNFGPLNRTGGERRLNVAITRARHELHVFSTLSSEHLDLSRTQVVGVRDLKVFLEYAERGPRALAEAVHRTSGEFESPFESAVGAALAQKGWGVHPQVGVSTFRIDLGIVDPKTPGRYLAGVECDGATYHRSATARDRDKLREQVLRGLGWNLVRIWSTDWWTDPSETLERAHVKLLTLREKLQGSSQQVLARIQ